MPPTVSRQVGPEGRPPPPPPPPPPLPPPPLPPPEEPPARPPPHGPRPHRVRAAQARPARPRSARRAGRRGRRGWRPRTAPGRCGRRPRPRPGPAGRGRPRRAARRSATSVWCVAAAEAAVSASPRASSRSSDRVRSWSSTSRYWPTRSSTSDCRRIALVEVLGVEHGGGVLERAGAHVALDGDLDEVLVEAVDLGLGLGLAPTGLGEVGVGLGQGALAVGEGGLLAGHVGVQGVEGGRHLVVGGLEHVDLGCHLGLLAPDPLPLGAGIGGRGGGGGREGGDQPQCAGAHGDRGDELAHRRGASSCLVRVRHGARGSSW